MFEPYYCGEAVTSGEVWRNQFVLKKFPISKNKLYWVIAYFQLSAKIKILKYRKY